jgi:hypothetical protein
VKIPLISLNDIIGTYVAFCIAFIADAPVLNASTVSVVAFAPSSIIICKIDIQSTKFKALPFNLHRFIKMQLKTKAIVRTPADLIMNT